MPEHGLHTIGQRINGIMRRPPTVSARPPTSTPGSASAGDFSSVLATQMGQAGGAPTSVLDARLPFTTGAPLAGHAAAAAGYAPAAAGVQLGAGVRLSQAPSVIQPSLPATGGVAAVGGGGGHAHHIGVAAHDHSHGPPALDRQGPPPELQPHGNGRIPAEALEPLGIGDHRLWSPAARAFRDLLAHAAADGVSIGVTSSYRTYDKQVELANRLGLYSQGGLAAAPGTSNHGWGVALDLQLDDTAQAWMREHARDYGFVEDVPREPWHWTFRASSY